MFQTFDSEILLTASILYQALSLQVLGLSSVEVNNGSIFLTGSLKFEPGLSILEDAHRLLNMVGYR